MTRLTTRTFPLERQESYVIVNGRYNTPLQKSRRTTSRFGQLIIRWIILQLLLPCLLAPSIQKTYFMLVFPTISAYSSPRWWNCFGSKSPFSFCLRFPLSSHHSPPPLSGNASFQDVAERNLTVLFLNKFLQLSHCLKCFCSGERLNEK